MNRSINDQNSKLKIFASYIVPHRGAFGHSLLGGGKGEDPRQARQGQGSGQGSSGWVSVCDGGCVCGAAGWPRLQGDEVLQGQDTAENAEGLK